MNGPLKFLTARKILPLLDLFAKFKPSARLLVLPKFLRCSKARKANFLFLLVLAKKSQCSQMLAKTIRHPYMTNSLSVQFILFLMMIFVYRSLTIIPRARMGSLFWFSKPTVLATSGL